MNIKKIGSLEIKYKFENDSENASITINDAGEFVYADCPIYWAEFKFSVKDKEFSLYAQFDCGDTWCWYNDGGDGESSEWTAEEYFDSDDEELIDFLNELLEESEPCTTITEGDKADYLRSNSDDEELFNVAKQVREICPEKSKDWALVCAFYNKDGIIGIGAWECHMQIYCGLSKDQTLALTYIF